jgi:hypothetical protein
MFGVRFSLTASLAVILLGAAPQGVLVVDAADVRLEKDQATQLVNLSIP